MTILAVIPSDPMSAYEAVGCHVWAERYYNPGHSFDRVYLLSPHEKQEVFQYGMHTVPTQPSQLKSRLRELGVDVVRAYGGYWPCDMACRNKARDVPVVVSVHDTNPDEFYASIRHADYVFCMSEAVRDLVLTRFERVDRVWLLPNRYDRDVMRPMPDEGFSDLDAAYPWRYRLVCVGRLSGQKNQETLIRALRLLGPDYGCVFVGRNDPAPLRKLAEEKAVADRCAFVESVRNDLLARYYNWAHAMVTPSRWEGFGIVFVEALACGAVVVTSNVAPMNEYIRHERNGLLVDGYETPSALAATVKRACEDEELRHALKANAPASVERFERRRVDDLEIRYYQRILAESRHEQAGRAWSKRVLSAISRKRPSPGPVEDSCARRAIEWVRYHSSAKGGIVHSPQMSQSYPEVSGYFIPTLLKVEERELAVRYAKWLLEIQNEDGSWNGVGTKTAYTFDTAQVLKGLLVLYRDREGNPGREEMPGQDELRSAILRGSDWLLSRIGEDGRVTTPAEDALQIPSGGSVPEAFYLYALSPLREAAGLLSRPDLEEGAQRALKYYLSQSDLGAFRTLSHFHAYIVEALIDLGRKDLAREALEEVDRLQRPDGSVPAWRDTEWVCSTGLAQYAVCWSKLDARDRARKAFAWLCAHQEPSGGFYGGYGENAAYFPRSEISWAVKYFLDAWTLLRRAGVAVFW
ncbi:glycosyltransferase [bacterium]|nr:glycosyltransferase [bacterium]